MPSVANHHTTILIAFATIALSGCASEMAQLSQDFAHPGSAAHQRARAIKHDPYVLNDVGPEVLGGRPREYMIPVNEVERARQDTTPPPSLRPATPTPVVIGPATSPSPYTVQPTPGMPPPQIITTPAPSPFPTQRRSPY